MSFHFEYFYYSEGKAAKLPFMQELLIIHYNGFGVEIQYDQTTQMMLLNSLSSDHNKKKLLWIVSVQWEDWSRFQWSLSIVLLCIVCVCIYIGWTYYTKGNYTEWVRRSMKIRKFKNAFSNYVMKLNHSPPTIFWYDQEMNFS